MVRVFALPTSMGVMNKYSCVEKAPAFILKNVKHAVIKPEITNQESYLKKVMERVPAREFICVGGDHSISYALVKRAFESNPGARLIVFDAHPDLEVSTDVPTHEDWLRMLVIEGVVKPKRLDLVGVTKVTSREQEFINQRGIRINQELSLKNELVYVSVDLDVLKGECFGYPDGKMSVKELMNYLNNILNNARVIGFDLVELCPDKPGGFRIARVGREIVKKVINALKN